MNTIEELKTALLLHNYTLYKIKHPRHYWNYWIIPTTAEHPEETKNLYIFNDIETSNLYINLPNGEEGNNIPVHSLETIYNIFISEVISE